MAARRTPTSSPSCRCRRRFLHILIAIGDEDRHGYAIMQDVADRTEGRVRMSPGTAVRSDPAHARRRAHRGAVFRMWRETTTSGGGTIGSRSLAGRSRLPRPIRLSTLVRQARVSGLVPRRS